MGLQMILQFIKFYRGKKNETFKVIQIRCDATSKEKKLHSSLDNTKDDDINIFFYF